MVRAVSGCVMERFVRLVAPTNRLDFLFKLVLFVLLSGMLNHTRAVLSHGWADANTFAYNLQAAAFTALPMSTLALLLIQHLNALQEKLYTQATTDQLTQLPNRRWFLEQCPPVLRQGMIMVLLDLDHFKAINDTHGHDTGDACLVAISDHFRAVLPENAQCARLGGEEFGILFKQTSLPQVQDWIGKICQGVQVSVGGDETVAVTVSAGILAVDGGVTMRRAFQLADAAMYDAKAAGRSRFAMAHIGDVNVSRPRHAGVRDAIA